ncbi:hypothetical protein LSCM1_00247 [Leishmania martiniquensis]|uniref:Uncharacterized protein n=1 Tax=Leishmania martiniquensis TaxID=1580590 RepID=A0A836FK66_9TRYP|nr:hypothetical protein LSCM1_00247 [Leishmania martiniquensis]
MKLGLHEPRPSAAGASRHLDANVEGDRSALSPALSSSSAAMGSSDLSSAAASAHSTPAPQGQGAFAVHDMRAALPKRHRWQCWHAKGEALPLLMEPVSCLTMVRVPAASHPKASSQLPNCRTQSFADREMSFVTDNQRTDVSADISDTTREKKRRRQPEYSKADIHRLRIKPVKNLFMCRVPMAGGGLSAEEAARYTQHSLSAVAARFATVDRRGGAVIVRGDGARREDHRRTRLYAKADIMSLRMKPLKGYAVYRVV